MDWINVKPSQGPQTKQGVSLLYEYVYALHHKLLYIMLRRYYCILSEIKTSFSVSDLQ